MSSRPRRSAAQRANVAITDLADTERQLDRGYTPMSSSRSSRRSGNGLASVSSGDSRDQQHMHLTVKMPSSKLRQATTASHESSGKRKALTSAAVSSSSGGGGSKRTRGGKKNYVIESSEDEEEEEEGDEDDDDDDEEEDDEDEEEEEEAEVSEIEVVPKTFGKPTARKVAAVDDEDDEQMEDVGDDDAEGEDDGDEMDVDAEGEDDEGEDADGDIDMDTPALRPPAIKVTKPPKNASTPSKSKPVAAKPLAGDDDDDDDDEELSELESEPEDVTVEVANNDDEDAEGEDDDEDVDAEGEEEIEVADEDAEGEDDAELLSEDGSRAGTPDLSKLTARQRAKLGDVSHEYMKLSDEVQAKKVFTAEELSMRRAEMARRRRNLSEKRNEEVKMETINKLLKKQAPKTTRKNAALLAAGDETPDGEGGTGHQRADPMFVRWVSSSKVGADGVKSAGGSRVGVPEELLSGPAGRVFLSSAGSSGKGVGGSGKMVEEVP
ncbi:PAPA-1-like conserved region-domain-containing protein [Dichotomopilus funicola]|uniref:PAPA-1-like conserved region-domain-containing protein n=1 Tax=Dichotomopilus funicola TaxID=1934379 RepID=A0AAN6UY00_9PEZI|nr:PAPA-1-like conserved region-domain-containing protein [Dichotomopilus funicola]